MASILVVEDDKLTAAALAFFLKDLGHQVHRAAPFRRRSARLPSRPST